MTKTEQHLPYRATADVVVLDGDGSRWVREDEAPSPSQWARWAARTLRRVAGIAEPEGVDDLAAHAVLGLKPGGCAGFSSTASVLSLADRLDGGYGGRAA